MIPVRQSTAFETAIGPILDADGVAVTGGVVGDFKIKKTTGNFAALNGSATLTHVSAGVYDLVLTTSDTDTVGLCVVAIDDTTNACASLYLQVMEEAVYDALYAASATGALPVSSGGIAASAFAASAIDAAALATDAVQEIRNAITGGAYALSTDASGMVRIVDGTGTGELNTSGGYIAGIAGTINTLDALDTAQDTQHSTTQAAISALNNLSAAQVNAEVDTALADINLDHLIKNAVDTDVPTTVHLNSVLGYVMDGGTAWSYDRTTDAMEVQGASHIVIDGNVSSIKTSTDAILLDTNELQTDWANGGRLDLIVDAILDDTGTAGVVVASDSKTGYSLASTGMDSVTLPANILTASALATDAVSEISAAVLTTAMTESYRGTGATATLAQACYEIIAHLGESAIVSTTKTLKKLDGSTTAKTYTLDSATTPTSITETT